MKRIIHILDTATELSGLLVAWLAALLVVATALVVLLRYVFSTGSISLQESLIYINVLLFVIGSGYTLKHDGHVRVDVFYNRMGKRRQAAINLFGTLFFLIPVVLYIIYSSWDYVAVSWRVRERSAESSGLPFVYLLKSGILLLACVLIWQGIAEVMRSIGQLSRVDDRG